LNEFIKSNNVVVARVINEEKNLFKILLNGVVYSAIISNKMLKSAIHRIDFPAVGDYVKVEEVEGFENKIITEILPRKTLLTRKQVGTISDAQVLASNVDIVFIATSLNQEFSVGRIERYLSFAYESGARPVLLLTKSDLMDSKEKVNVLEALKKRFSKLDIHFMSHLNFQETSVFADLLTPEVTAVVLGSSGVGKSTLVNYLIGNDKNLILTQETRQGDDKGRHTTTSRSLYSTKFGGMIIDTPGMRELQFLNHNKGLTIEYEDVEEIVACCKFSNCQHESEPGCAINEAIESGRLEISRFKNFQKLKSELRYAERRQDKRLMAIEKLNWKKRSKLAREEFKANRR
jgi:ribosome biogenesis GTPase